MEYEKFKKLNIYTYTTLFVLMKVLKTKICSNSKAAKIENEHRATIKKKCQKSKSANKLIVLEHKKYKTQKLLQIKIILETK